MELTDRPLSGAAVTPRQGRRCTAYVDRASPCPPVGVGTLVSVQVWQGSCSLWLAASCTTIWGGFAWYGRSVAWMR